MSINKILRTIKKYRNNENITMTEAQNILKTNEDVVLLDVRSPQEYKEGHLERSYKYTIL